MADHTDRTNVVVPTELKRLAKEYGINMSDVFRKALRQEVVNKRDRTLHEALVRSAWRTGGRR